MVLWGLIALAFFSCESELSPDSIALRRRDEPRMEVYNFKYIYTDSGKVQAILTAPYAKEVFKDAKTNETEFVFPRGFVLRFFNEEGIEESRITARYGKIYDRNTKAMARGAVRLQNSEGSLLETEELYWDQQKDRVYTDRFVKITTAREVVYGEGLEADSRFQWYTLRSLRGTFVLADSL